MQFISLTVLIRRIRAIKNLLFDPSVPKSKKILIIFGIIYLLVPFDLIPAPVLGFSVIDDMAVMLFILAYLSDELDQYSEKKDETGGPDIDISGRDVYESTGETLEDEDSAESGSDGDESVEQQDK